MGRESALTVTMDDSSGNFHDSKPFRDEPSSTFDSGSTSTPISQKIETIELEYSIEGGLRSPEAKWKITPATKCWCCCSAPCSGHLRRRLCHYSSLMAFVAILIVIVAVPVTVKKNKSTSAADAGTTSNGNQAKAPSGESTPSTNDPALEWTPSTKVPFTANDDVFFYAMPDMPFSTMDPVEGLGMYAYERPAESSPSARLDPLRENTNNAALPTNSWYQNLLRLGADEVPNVDHKAYTIPYVVDAAGAILGVRIHGTRLVSTSTQVTLTIDEPFGLTLGAMDAAGSADSNVTGYTVHHATELGISLQWDAFDGRMRSTFVLGMPYVTMVYNTTAPSSSSSLSTVLPTIYSEIGLSEVIIDGATPLDCEGENEFRVQQELQLKFLASGQRWMVFFSRPVEMQCQGGGPTILQVINEGLARSASSAPLIVRVALVVSSSDTAQDDETFESEYVDLLRSQADIFPAESTGVSYSFDSDQNDPDRARITFDWGARSMLNGGAAASRSADDMLMFALPHHQDLLNGTSTVVQGVCTPSMTGPVCLARGTFWSLDESLPRVDLRAPRHPDAAYLPDLAGALMEDIGYQIPENFQTGAADTYFSAKTIAKLARILLITEEVRELCSPETSQQTDKSSEYTAACEGVDLPSDEEVDLALDQLRQTMTVWIKDNQQAPFVYDSAWGGVVSCGCLYDSGQCTNQFPDCPSFTDPGLNFGNGFYNDHHFHYGYYVYGAAVLAHFDPLWGMEHFEGVLSLVRDFANPSDQDTAFPIFRNKDSFRGHSWASGFSADPMFPNIMNQESLSEAIASYESVALFGKVMAAVYDDAGEADKSSVASLIHKAGLVLTATEIRSTQKYWHVVHGAQDSIKVYPDTYEPSVVGILWSTMIIFTTWFGNNPYLIYGIQLLPLTPIAEHRDDLAWAKEIYTPLAASCDQRCVSEGWSVQILAILATIGHVDRAINGTLQLASTVYDSPGGNGHSKSNTLWYISTRPSIEDPFPEEDLSVIVEVPELTCFQPSQCTGDYLNSMAGEFSCRSRIEWLMSAEALSQRDACIKIAVDEFPAECSLCDPSGAVEDVNEGSEGGDANRTNTEIVVGVDSGGGDANTTNADVNEDGEVGLTCLQPTKCTALVLDAVAGEFSCRDRIQYLIDSEGLSEESACRQIAVDESPEICGPCDPL